MFKNMVDLANSFRVAAKNDSLHLDGVIAYGFCADAVERLAQVAPPKAESTEKSDNTGSPKCPACGIYRCESCGRPVTPEMKGICECGSLRADG